MSSLVARFAQNIYWLGRYLERAECTARILDINETYARDDVQGPDWGQVLKLFDDTARFKQSHDEQADARAVLNFYVLDRDNPNSILSSITAARENARSVRHLISTEMWTHLNIVHGRMAALTQRDIWLSHLSATARQIIADCQTFEGIAEGTLLRSEPWCFYSLGKFIERADQSTRILDMGYDQLSIKKGDAVAFVHWNVLLRSVCGYHAYRQRHPGTSSPRDIAAFLLYDDEFPRSVSLCVNRMSQVLRDLERRHGARRDTTLETARRALEFALETGPARELTERRLHAYIDQIQRELAALSTAIEANYFGVDAPA